MQQLKNSLNEEFENLRKLKYYHLFTLMTYANLIIVKMKSLRILENNNMLNMDLRPMPIMHAHDMLQLTNSLKKVSRMFVGSKSNPF